MGPGSVASRVSRDRSAAVRWCTVLLVGVALAGCGLVPQPGVELPPPNQAAGTPGDAGTSGVAGSLPVPAPPVPAPAPAPPGPVVPASAPPAPAPPAPPAPAPPAPPAPAPPAPAPAAPAPPAPVVPALPVAPAPSATEAIETRIAELVNQARAEANLPPLVVSAELTQASRTWTEQMASSFGLVHDPGLAVPPGARLAGENVAYRTTDADVGANLHAQFMASQGHRENVLEPAYTTMGIGVVQSGDRTWVTERFVG